MKKKSIKLLVLNSIKSAQNDKDTNKEKFLNRVLFELKPILANISEVNLAKENLAFLEYFEKEAKNKEKKIQKYSRKKQQDLLEMESHELAIIRFLTSSIKEKVRYFEEI